MLSPLFSGLHLLIIVGMIVSDFLFICSTIFSFPSPFVHLFLAFFLPSSGPGLSEVVQACWCWLPPGSWLCRLKLSAASTATRATRGTRGLHRHISSLNSTGWYQGRNTICKLSGVAPYMRKKSKKLYLYSTLQNRVITCFYRLYNPSSFLFASAQPNSLNMLRGINGIQQIIKIRLLTAKCSHPFS